MAQLWGGRFTKETDQLVYRFNASIGFDQKFYRQDIQGSMAHVRMLAKQGILTEEEKEQILKGLESILEDVENHRLEITEEYEDIHSFVEANLIQRIGDAGKKLHTGSPGDGPAGAGSAEGASEDHGGKPPYLYAGIHPSPEGTADHAGTSYGSVF